MDRYFAIRYQKKGYGRHEEGLGWASDGWTVEKAILELKKLKDAAQIGDGPVSLAEKRRLAIEKREIEKAEREQAEKEAITFDEFFNENYLPYAISNKSERTVNREKGLYQLWIKDTIGFMQMSKIAPLNLESIKEKMQKHDKAPRTIEYALVVVRQVFHYARDRKVIKTIPFLFTKRNYKRSDALQQGKIIMPKVDNSRMRYFSLKEIEKLLNALKARSQDVYDMTILAIHAGLRFSEITGLTWADINLADGILTIRDAKTGSRFAHLTPEAAETLKTRKQGKPFEYVFQKRGKKGERVTSISHVFYRTIQDLGFNEGIKDRKLKLCFHSCRHTFGTLMYEKTNDLYVTQKALGHATNIMTQRYAKMADNRLKEATLAVGNALKQKTKN